MLKYSDWQLAIHENALVQVTDHHRSQLQLNLPLKVFICWYNLLVNGCSYVVYSTIRLLNVISCQFVTFMHYILMLFKLEVSFVSNMQCCFISALPCVAMRKTPTYRMILANHSDAGLILCHKVFVQGRVMFHSSTLSSGKQNSNQNFNVFVCLFTGGKGF